MTKNTVISTMAATGGICSTGNSLSITNMAVATSSLAAAPISRPPAAADGLVIRARPHLSSGGSSRGSGTGPRRQALVLGEQYHNSLLPHWDSIILSSALVSVLVPLTLEKTHRVIWKQRRLLQDRLPPRRSG